MSKPKSNWSKGVTSVVCRECGQSMNNLTWTHLKWKCVKPMSLSDYRKKHPDQCLKIEIPEREKMTKEGFILRFGESDGFRKFEEYRTLHSNKNKKEFMMKSKNMTSDEVDLYNKSRSATLENFKLRHGDELGTVKWNSYVKTQKFKGCDVKYFQEKYGECDGLEFYRNLNAKNVQIFKISNENWESDLNDKKFIESLGYDLLVVWENDYRNSPDETIKTCLEFLNGS